MNAADFEHCWRIRVVLLRTFLPCLRSTESDCRNQAIKLVTVSLRVQSGCYANRQLPRRQQTECKALFSEVMEEYGVGDDGQLCRRLQVTRFGVFLYTPS